MVEERYVVVWNKTARTQVRNIYNYIAKDSLQNAKKVVEGIVQSTNQLEINPERFAKDKYKQNNDGTYRYYELYNYRIVFRIYKNHIRIIRLRSTHQEPKDY
ncbi:MAG: type II toxin-antitoxin system RelE/ParE family toxin [Chitinophagales bacterium]|nr:type II toxin-antitoxin system RelE/ParE family toxin [Chitinophagales bacterium]